MFEVDTIYNVVMSPSTAVGLISYPILSRTLKFLIIVGASLALLSHLWVGIKKVGSATKWVAIHSYNGSAAVYRWVRTNKSGTSSNQIVAMFLLIPILAGCAGNPRSQKVVTIDGRKVNLTYDSKVKMLERPDCDVPIATVRLANECKLTYEDKFSIENLDKKVREARAESNTTMTTEEALEARDKTIESVCGLEETKIQLTACLSEASKSFLFNPFDILEPKWR